MITIKKVTTRRQGRQFSNFPNKMYKDVPAFTPFAALEENATFSPRKNAAYEYVSAVRFLAYKDNKIVGRIAGLINHKYNDAFKTKQVRFSRIDMIDDIEVTRGLINAVEDWGKKHGMTEIIGPIGFSDMDQQGLLVEGFDELSMMITIYNHPYYHDHLTELGFMKDADWVEYKITWPKETPKKITTVANVVRRRYGYKLITPKNRREAKKYFYNSFEVYNNAYKNLYGFVPLSDAVVKHYVQQLMIIAQLQYMWFVEDKEGKLVSFGLIIPSLSKVLKRINGKLLPFGWIPFFRALKNHEVLDLYMIAVDPEHQNKGVLALIMEDAIEKGIKNGTVYAETGPELEDNIAIQSQWKEFEHTQHKRRRCYIKPIK